MIDEGIKSEIKLLKNPWLQIIGIVVASVLGILGESTIHSLTNSKLNLAQSFMEVMKKKGAIDKTNKLGRTTWTKVQPFKRDGALGPLIFGIIEIARLAMKPKRPGTTWNGQQMFSEELVEPFSQVPAIVEWNEKPLLTAAPHGRIASKYSGQFGLDEAYPAYPKRASGSIQEDGVCNQQGGLPKSDYETPSNPGSPNYEKFRRKDTGAINWDAVLRCGDFVTSEGGKPPDAALNARRRRISEAYNDDVTAWENGLNQYIDYNRTIDMIKKADMALEYFREKLKQELVAERVGNLKANKPQYSYFVRRFLDLVEKYTTKHKELLQELGNKQKPVYLYQVFNILVFCGWEAFSVSYPSEIPKNYIYNIVANSVWEWGPFGRILSEQDIASAGSMIKLVLQDKHLGLGVQNNGSDPLSKMEEMMLEYDAAWVDGKFSEDKFVKVGDMYVHALAHEPSKTTGLWYASYNEFFSALMNIKNNKTTSVLYPFETNPRSADNAYLKANGGGQARYNQTLPDFEPYVFLAERPDAPPVEPVEPVEPEEPIEPEEPPVKPPIDPEKPAEKPVYKPVPVKSEKEIQLGLQLLKSLEKPKKEIKRRRIRLYNPNL